MHHRVTGTIRIQNGATLTISGNSVIEFGDSRGAGVLASATSDANLSRIVVEPGGFLRVISSTLRNNTAGPDSTMWDGIVLLGDPADGQRVGPIANVPTGLDAQDPNQGHAYIVNSTIRNARIGILAGTPAYAPPSTVTVNNPFPRILDVNNADPDGGGWAFCQSTRFINCHKGVYVRAYRPGNGNANQFRGCTFRSYSPLRDVAFYTYGFPANYPALGEPCGMQYGIQAYRTGNIRVNRCTFELDDANFPTGFAPVYYAGRGQGLGAINGEFSADACEFMNLYYGIFSKNTDNAYSGFVTNSHFTGNVYGAQLNSCAMPELHTNRFFVGRHDGARATQNFATGIKMESTGGLFIWDNRFNDSPSPTCTNDICSLTRGVDLRVTDDNTPTGMTNRVYRNFMDSLATGIYLKEGNHNVHLRCNSFRGRNFASGARMRRADIETLAPTAQGDIINDQGVCNPNNEAAAANNLFSHTGGTARDIFNYQGTLTSTTTWWDYWYIPTGLSSEYTRPILNYNGVTPIATTDASIGCMTGVTFDYDEHCGPVIGASKAQLRAALDTLTDPQARSEAISDLVRLFLTDTLDIHGVDSVIVLLEGLQEDGYDDLLAAFNTRAGNSSSRSAARASGLVSRIGTEAQNTTASTYYQQVRALLAPYATESAIRAVLVADADMRGQLEAMAADSVTWGADAARTVLSYYLGYTYANEESGAAERSGQLATLAASRPTEQVATFAPNPTTGTVQVRYRLPSEAANGRLLVYDQMGTLCQQLSLADNAGEATLNLTKLPEGLYSYRVLAGERLVQTGKVVKLP